MPPPLRRTLPAPRTLVLTYPPQPLLPGANQPLRRLLTITNWSSAHVIPSMSPSLLLKSCSTPGHGWWAGHQPRPRVGQSGLEIVTLLLLPRHMSLDESHPLAEPRFPRRSQVETGACPPAGRGKWRGHALVCSAWPDIGAHLYVYL